MTLHRQGRLLGAPGTGKSELTRVVAQTLGARRFEVGDSDDDGTKDTTPARQRLIKCGIAQRCLRRAPRSMLVFDEVEDTFHVRREGADLLRESSGKKAWTHGLVERAPLPTVPPFSWW